ncbi:MAG: ATPase, T2SS/T4P/T4SS family [Egibacteraceae bacterium]
MCDARLPDGSRVNVVLPPLALRGPALTIRKFPESPMQVTDLVEKGSITPQVAAFLESCVAGKLNILVSGGTGTGKTTLLNAVSGFIPPTERIITIEDSAELQLHQPHVLPMEARPANAEGMGLIGIRDLVRNALRMRPDRIVVGEVRGAEALDMLQAMNTGHEGSLTTLHANSPRDALSRLETMVLMAGMELPLRAIRDQVASALDLVVQLDRFGDGRRVVTTITEVQGMEGDVIVLQDLFSYQFTAGGTGSTSSVGATMPTGLRPKVLEKLEAAGIPIAPSLFAAMPAKPERRQRGVRA